MLREALRYCSAVLTNSSITPLVAWPLQPQLVSRRENISAELNWFGATLSETFGSWRRWRRSGGRPPCSRGMPRMGKIHKGRQGYKEEEKEEKGKAMGEGVYN